jgi:WD40 repeat protein
MNEEKKEEEKKEENKEENYNDFDFDGIQDSSKANPPKKPDEENSIKIIEDKSNYSCKMKLHGHPSDVNCIFETSQNKIVSCGKDDYILIWSLDSPETPIKIKGHENGVGCGIELNDNTIVTGGGDKKIKIWDLRIIDQQKPYATMKGHTNAIFSICKINDEKLASASCDKSIRIWDLKNYVCTLIFEGHSGFVWSLVNLVRYNKDKNRKDSEEEVKNLLVSASSDKTIKFWDVEEHRCVKTIFAHDKEITTLGKLKDGNIIRGSLDSTIKIWKI